MDPLRAALTELAPADADEATALARLHALCDTGDAWSRALPLHVTASALVVHRPTRRVLLRWHPRLDGWFQVGGHGDPGEQDPWRVALREAAEETGLTDLVALAPEFDRRPAQLVVVPVPATADEAAHEHADLRYLLTTVDPEAAQAETAAAAVRWFTLAEARAVVGTPDLVALLEAAEGQLDLPAAAPPGHALTPGGAADDP